MNVPDLQAMTDALRSHQPGDTVDIVVRRGDQRPRRSAPRSASGEAEPCRCSTPIASSPRSAARSPATRDGWSCSRLAAEKIRGGRRALHLGLPVHAARRGAGARGLRRPGDRAHPHRRGPRGVRHRRGHRPGPERARRARDLQLHRLQRLDALRAGRADPPRQPRSWARSTWTATSPTRSRPTRRRRSGRWRTPWPSCSDAMRAWSSARFTIALPDGHRFPIAKYARIRDEVVARGLLPARAIEEPDRADRWALELVHTPRVRRRGARRHLTPAEMRRLGFPWSSRAAGAFAPHRPGHGRGRARRPRDRARASISPAARTTPFPTTAKDSASSTTSPSRSACCSARAGSPGPRSWTSTCTRATAPRGSSPTTPTSSPSRCTARATIPFRKERSALDVELDDGCEDAAYLAALDAHLGPVLDAARPELVFYLGGADPFVHDRFGRLGLSMPASRARDRLAFGAFRRRGLPVVVTLAGGYARRAGGRGHHPGEHGRGRAGRLCLRRPARTRGDGRGPRVELFVRRVGEGPPAVVLHGGPGAHHDYLLPGLRCARRGPRADLLRPARRRPLAGRHGTCRSAGPSRWPTSRRSAGIGASSG